MNILDLQDKLKNLSEQQLVQAMQMPTGQMPQFLVLGELTRRKTMRDAFAQEQNKEDTTTVAQEAVAAAGMPPAFAGQMAGTMAPQTNMATNSGAAPQQSAMPAPTQKMAGGGIVALQDGGKVDRNVKDNVDAYYADILDIPAMRDSGEGDYSSTDAQVKRLQHPTQGVRGRDDAVYMDRFFNNSPYNAVYDSDGSLRMSGPDTFGYTDTRRDSAAVPDASILELWAGEMRALSRKEMSGEPLSPKESELLRSYQEYFSGRTGMAEGGLVKLNAGGKVDRYAPGGIVVRNGIAYREDPETGELTDLAGNPLPETFRDEARGPQSIGEVGDLMDYITANRPAPPSVSDVVAAPEIPLSGGAVNRAELPGGYTSGDVDRTDPSGLPYFDLSMPDGIPRGVGQMADEARVPLRGGVDPYLNLGYAAGPDQPTAPATGAAPSVNVGAGVMDPRLARILAQSRLPRPMAPPPTADAPPEDNMDGTASLRTMLLQQPSPSGPVGMPRDAMPDAANPNRTWREWLNTPVVDLMGIEVPEGEVPGLMERITGAPDSDVPDEPPAEPQVEPIVAPDVETRTTPLAGVGAGAAGAPSDYEQELLNMLQAREKRAEQDKWLALAQAGMALMSSNQPTFGGALGEAGQAGLGALREGQSTSEADRLALLGQLEQSRLSREELAIKRQAASARGSTPRIPAALITPLIDRLDAAQEALGQLPPPREPGWFGQRSDPYQIRRTELGNEVANLQQQINMLYLSQTGIEPFGGGSAVPNLSDSPTG